MQDITFYKTQDGHLVKTKSSISASRITTDAAFVRTRENGTEFGSAAKAGKILRDSLRVLNEILMEYEEQLSFRYGISDTSEIGSRRGRVRL